MLCYKQELPNIWSCRILLDNISWCSKDSHCLLLSLHLQQALRITCDTHFNLYASPDRGSED